MKRRIRLLLPILFILLACKVHAQPDCSQCSVSLMRADSLSKKTFSQLNLLKAELYARHGFTFENTEWAQHFSAFDWYKPVQRNVAIVLNDVEKENVLLINQAMKDRLGLMIRPEQSSAKRASQEAIETYFPAPMRRSLRLFSYDIGDVYFYSDERGKHCLILSHTSYDPYNEQGNTFSRTIKASFCNVEGERFMYPENELTDLTLLSYSELDIRFLTQYTSITDIDGDGIADPIVVYATMRDKGYQNGWVKVVLQYRASLVTIYVAGSINERERAISITSGYYTLPESIQLRLKNVLLQVQEDGFVSLPAAWAKKMGFSPHD